MSRPRRVVAAESPSLSEHLEQMARSLEAGRFAAVAKRAEWFAVEAGRAGRGPLVRHAALLLSAAERRDAAGAVSALVFLARGLDEEAAVRLARAA